LPDEADLRLSPNDDRIAINLSQDGDKISIARVALFPAETHQSDSLLRSQAEFRATQVARP
jgi:regulation of enolase protein 1 (concanavalin A-like superfamily)